MTAIVGFSKNGKVYMACDSLGSSEQHKNEYSNSKIFFNKDLLIGYTTSFRFGDILEYLFEPPYRMPNMTDKEYLIKSLIPELRKCLEHNKYTDTSFKGESGTCLIGYKGVLYSLQNDFSILVSKYNYDSCGSGYAYCLGALNVLYETGLSPEQIVKQAIESAIRHNPYVGGNIVIKVLEN